MILGIGVDLVDIRRIEGVLERHGQRFKNYVYTAEEQAYCERKAESAAAYARHFAAKEAVSKAIGTGISGGVGWKQMRLRRFPNKPPKLELVGVAKERMDALTPKGMTPQLHLSISDEPPYATAFVTLSAI